MLLTLVDSLGTHIGATSYTSVAALSHGLGRGGKNTVGYSAWNVLNKGNLLRVYLVVGEVAEYRGIPSVRRDATPSV